MPRGKPLAPLVPAPREEPLNPLERRLPALRYCPRDEPARAERSEAWLADVERGVGMPAERSGVDGCAAVARGDAVGVGAGLRRKRGTSALVTGLGGFEGDGGDESGSLAARRGRGAGIDAGTAREGLRRLEEPLSRALAGSQRPQPGEKCEGSARTCAAVARSLAPTSCGSLALCLCSAPEYAEFISSFVPVLRPSSRMTLRARRRLPRSSSLPGPESRVTLAGLPWCSGSRTCHCLNTAPVRRPRFGGKLNRIRSSSLLPHFGAQLEA